MLWCSLGEEGAIAIADFLKKNKKVKEINLYMNDVGNGGAYKVSLPCITIHHHLIILKMLYPPFTSSQTFVHSHCVLEHGHGDICYACQLPFLCIISFSLIKLRHTKHQP